MQVRAHRQRFRRSLPWEYCHDERERGLLPITTPHSFSSRLAVITGPSTRTWLPAFPVVAPISPDADVGVYFLSCRPARQTSKAYVTLELAGRAR